MELTWDSWLKHPTFKGRYFDSLEFGIFLDRLQLVVKQSKNETVCTNKVAEAIRLHKGNTRAHIFVFIVKTFNFTLNTRTVVKPVVIYHQLHLGSEFIIGIMYDTTKKKRTIKGFVEAIATQAVLS